jgi:hypothetical protein
MNLTWVAVLIGFFDLLGAIVALAVVLLNKRDWQTFIDADRARLGERFTKDWVNIRVRIAFSLGCRYAQNIGEGVVYFSIAFLLLTVVLLIIVTVSLAGAQGSEQVSAQISVLNNAAPILLGSLLVLLVLVIFTCTIAVFTSVLIRLLDVCREAP